MERKLSSDLNIRRGFGRAYTVISALAVASVLAFGVSATPDDHKHSHEDNDFLSRMDAEMTSADFSAKVQQARDAGYESKEIVSFLCTNRTADTGTLDKICQDRDQAIKSMKAKAMALHVAKVIAAMLATASALFAIRKSIGWVLDGFSAKD